MAMPLVIRYHHDAHGYPRAVVEPPNELVGAYLEQDVQGDVQSGLELLAAIEDVSAGRLARWKGTGNADHLTLAEGIAVIENRGSDSAFPCRIGLQEFGEALAWWLSFVRTSDA